MARSDTRPVRALMLGASHQLAGSVFLLVISGKIAMLGFHSGILVEDPRSGRIFLLLWEGRVFWLCHCCFFVGDIQSTWFHGKVQSARVRLLSMGREGSDPAEPFQRAASPPLFHRNAPEESMEAQIF